MYAAKPALWFVGAAVPLLAPVGAPLAPGPTETARVNVITSAEITNNSQNSGACDADRYSFDFGNSMLTGTTTDYLRTTLLAGAEGEGVRPWNGARLYYDGGLPNCARVVVPVAHGQHYWNNSDKVLTGAEVSSWNCPGNRNLLHDTSTQPERGDGALEPSQDCDDANTDSGDGCSSTCTVEDGWQCGGEPSVCTPIELVSGFDVIYIDDMDVTLCDGCGTTLSSYGFALIVNTGTEDITALDTDSLCYDVISSVDGIDLHPFLSNLSLFAPIMPDEAVGSVVSPYNDVLLGLVEAEETFRNTAPSQVLAFQIDRDVGNTYVGDVVFDVTMRMGAQTATFQIHAYLNLGAHGHSFLGASRTSSIPIGEPQVLFVDASAPPGGDGSTWETAYNDLQQALSISTAGDEIRVAAGTYTPGDPYDDRTATFRLSSGVSLYGGYAGLGAPDPDARDVALYETILSGDLNGDDGIDFTNNDDNSYHVVTGGARCEEAVLDGCTIMAGNANGSCRHSRGAGITDNWSWLRISGCTLARNTGASGGAVCASSGSTMTDCTITENVASSLGGGILGFGEPEITNCLLTWNTAELGGGLYNDWGSPTVTNCIFSNNSADWRGGGMYNYGYDWGSPAVTNCIFSNNSAGWQGGAMYNYGHEWSNPTVSNCTFSNNSADWQGGGIYNDGYDWGTPTVANCIVWGNTPDQIYNNTSLPPIVTYSCIEGGYDGPGNIDDDPQLVGGGDLHLQPGSPCIDAADNTAVPIDTADLDNDGGLFERTPLDLEGCPRFVDDPPPGGSGVPDPPDYPDIVDMGAYELSDCSSTGEACCLEVGTCLNQTPGDCENMLGVPQGADTQCTVEQACCLPDGTCEMVDPLCCEEMGGEFSPIGEPVCLGDGNGNDIDDACELPEPKRPMPEEYSSPCSSDLDCPNASVCVPPPQGGAGNGICYVPKNRYLSIARHPQQAPNTARRIRCARDDQAVLGWVGEPVWHGELGGLWLSDVVGAPVYSGGFGTTDGEWPDVVQVGGAGIGPAQAFHVQAIHIGSDPYDEDSCSEPLQLPMAPVWGDVVGEYSTGSCTPPNGVADQDDIDAVVDAWHGYPTCPLWCDLAPETTDLIIDWVDIPWVIYAVDGEPYPWQTPCPAAPRPQPESPACGKNRYISFGIGNPGRDTALRVTLTDLPAPFQGDEGCQLWVGAPSDVSESSGDSGSAPPPTFVAGDLQSDPHCMDWGAVGSISVSDDEMVPGAVYEVQAIDCGSSFADEANYSAPLAIAMSQRGDIVGVYNGPSGSPLCHVDPDSAYEDCWGSPDGVIDFDDITAMVDKFRNLPGAPIKSRVDIAPETPDQVVDFVDIPHLVDAFRGLPYPFDGPDECPGTAKATSSAGPLAPEADSAARAEPALLTLQPIATSVRPGDQVEVDVHATGAVNLCAYQLSAIASGGRSGELIREELGIDTERFDYVFNAEEIISAEDMTRGRLGATTMAGGVDVEGPVYLGTFMFRASADASGTFELALRGDESTFLRDSSIAVIPYAVDRGALVTVSGSPRVQRLEKKGQ